MKVKRNGLDTFFYCIFCLASFGSLWIIRLVISAAIRHALDNDEE